MSRLLLLTHVFFENNLKVTYIHNYEDTMKAIQSVDNVNIIVILTAT